MSSIQKRLGKAFVLTAFFKYSSVLISILFTGVLARILSPVEYGVFAIVIVFIIFFRFLGVISIGPAIIQNKNLNDTDLISIFSFSICIGIILAILFFLSASLISHFYQINELETIIKLLSLSVLFFSLNVVPQSLNYKKFLFKEIGIIELSVQIITSSIAIYFALKGFSFYSLVIKNILDGLFIFVANYYLSPIKITRKINLISITKIAKFASFQFLFNFFNYFSRNADNLLIGKYLNTSSLGFYDKAYQLMMMPIANLSYVMNPFIQPILSDFQNDKKIIYISYLKIIKLLSIIGFPLSAFLFFSARDIILVFLGSQWVESVIIFKLLSITVGLQIVLSSSGSIFQSSNRTDLLFLSGLLGSIFMVGGILYGIFVGKNLEAIGYCLIISFTFYFLETFFILISKVLKVSFVSFLKIFIYPIIASLTITIALWILKIPSNNYNVIWGLITNSIVSGLIFLLFFLFPKENRKLLKIKSTFLKRTT